MTNTRIQTANHVAHYYNVTSWLLYTDMFIVPVIKTCLYFIKREEMFGCFLKCAPPKHPASDFHFLPSQAFIHKYGIQECVLLSQGYNLLISLNKICKQPCSWKYAYSLYKNSILIHKEFCILKVTS